MNLPDLRNFHISKDRIFQNVVPDGYIITSGTFPEIGFVVHVHLKKLIQCNFFFKDFPYINRKQMRYHHKQHMTFPALVTPTFIMSHSQVAFTFFKVLFKGHLKVAAQSSS